MSYNKDRALTLIIEKKFNVRRLTNNVFSTHCFEGYDPIDDEYWVVSKSIKDGSWSCPCRQYPNRCKHVNRMLPDLIKCFG